jgi:DNA-binding winged helix-turn-helix (wHTH) protein/predicted TPR repeat methyltransferase
VAAGAIFSFGGFQLDSGSRRLTSGGRRVPIPERHLDVLAHLVAHAGAVVSKDALVAAAWQDVAVTDNSLEQAISSLRRTLGAGADGSAFIETVPRRGYRFSAPVAHVAGRESDDSLDALLAPHRAFLEGRAAVETLGRDQVVVAQQAFAKVLEAAPDHAPAHVGAANARVFLFESTRADEHPDTAALRSAVEHAREACRLDASWAEAWATLGFTLHRTGDLLQALAASRRAVALEPDNWKHHLRLAFVSWGEERLRAVDRTLRLLPGLALAHWLAATVYVARQSFDAAERELEAGGAAQDAQSVGPVRFGAVGLHWLRGLVRLVHGDSEAAMAAFERELAFEASGHLYARECCANAWYAIGALRLRHGDARLAVAAFGEALARVPVHAGALAALAIVGDDRAATEKTLAARLEAMRRHGAPVEAAIADAISRTLRGDAPAAAAIVQRALSATPAPAAAWFLPVEPVLHASGHPAWAALLAAVRTRAA